MQQVRDYTLHNVPSKFLKWKKQCINYPFSHFPIILIIEAFNLKSFLQSEEKHS
jgi:hypothetical protein